MTKRNFQIAVFVLFYAHNDKLKTYLKTTTAS